ncbi:MAG: HAD-IIIA family hydrolase [Verrucomicrobia bacterium]|nr:HAD-IIIA family hydrolase [Verrucomicrobiota bacterium]
MIDCAIILAGGKGTRLASVAGSIPKVLVPVGDRPVLAHQLDLLSAAGYKDVRIFAGHLAEQIEAFVSGNQWPDLKIQIEVESTPLGSAGAVIEKLDTLPEQFTVLYGDTMLAVDLPRMTAFHDECGADVTILVHPNDHPFDSDLVETDAEGKVTALHSYPHPTDACYRNIVSAALYVVQRESLRPWAGKAEKYDFAKNVFPAVLASGGCLFAYHSHEYIKDMGTPERLKKVERDLSAGRIKMGNVATAIPVVFLDRDGTLNAENGYVRSPDQLQLLPNVAGALRLMREAGYRLIVITNQPVIARGEASEADLAAIHQKLEWELGLEGAYLDAIFHCPHHPDSGFPGERVELKMACQCRKPATGMLDLASAEFPIDIGRSWMIGDTTIDMEFASRAGLRSILVQTGSCGRDGKFPSATPDFSANGLMEAAEIIADASKPLFEA